MDTPNKRKLWAAFAFILVGTLGCLLSSLSIFFENILSLLLPQKLCVLAVLTLTLITIFKHNASKTLIWVIFILSITALGFDIFSRLATTFTRFCSLGGRLPRFTFSVYDIPKILGYAAMITGSTILITKMKEPQKASEQST